MPRKQISCVFLFEAIKQYLSQNYCSPLENFESKIAPRRIKTRYVRLEIFIESSTEITYGVKDSCHCRTLKINFISFRKFSGHKVLETMSRTACHNHKLELPFAPPTFEPPWHCVIVYSVRCEVTEFSTAKYHSFLVTFNDRKRKNFSCVELDIQTQ